MINPEDPTVSDLRASLTRDEIVAKLLVWLPGSIFPMHIEAINNDFVKNELNHLTKLDVSLNEHLTHMEEAAMQEFWQCEHDNAPFEVKDAIDKKMMRVRQLIGLAQEYVSDIDHEIGLDANSTLQVAQNDPGDTDEVRYTLTSADEWTKKTYGISIKNYPKAVADYFDDDEEEEDEDEEDDGKGGLTKTKANNLYVTVALLVEAFLEADPAYAMRLADMEKQGENWQSPESVEAAKSAKLIVSNLGKYLSLRSKVPGSRKFHKSQSDEAIMTRLEVAMKFKDEAWAKKVRSK
jgi:hypothetical protein